MTRCWLPCCLPCCFFFQCLFPDCDFGGHALFISEAMRQKSFERIELSPFFTDIVLAVKIRPASVCHANCLESAQDDLEAAKCLPVADV